METYPHIIVSVSKELMTYRLSKSAYRSNGVINKVRCNYENNSKKSQQITDLEFLGPKNAANRRP